VQDEEKSNDTDEPKIKESFPGWRKASWEIIEKHGKSKVKHFSGKKYLNQKVMLKKVWKWYSKSKQFAELSLDQRETIMEKGVKGIEEVVMRIIDKE